MCFFFVFFMCLYIQYFLWECLFCSESLFLVAVMLKLELSPLSSDCITYINTYISNAFVIWLGKLKIKKRL